MEKANKVKLIKIWEILSQETDENHPISTPELLAKLAEMGIECDRRTLYADIKALNACGYEILCLRSSSNEYYVEDRAFSLPELRIMIDAVQAASFITTKKTGEFVDKIASLAGSRRGELLKKNVVAFNTKKTDNEKIYYNVDTINAAIAQKKKVRFVYFDFNAKRERVYRKSGKFYYINAFSTIMDNGNYYLVGYDDFHRSMLHFRVDRMEQVTVSRHLANEFPELKAFDIQQHKKALFGMYAGEEKEVSLRADKSLIDVVFDFFGSDTNVFEVDENTIGCNVNVQLSPQFFGWCCSFGDKLKIDSPDFVVEEFKKYLENLANRY
jgi:predicted DNA-binding transcriptional regulator YafY